MRFVVAIVAALAGCGPSAGGGDRVPPGYNPPTCTPTSAPSLTALAIAHANGTPYAVGDVFDTAVGGQGLTMAHFTLRLTGSVPACVQPSVTVGLNRNDDARVPSPVDGGALIEYYLGPIDTSQQVMVHAAVGALTADVAEAGRVLSVH